MKRLAAILLWLGLASVGFAQVRVHCGGPAYTDSKGNVWQADTDFTGGAPYGPTVATISGASDPQLFEDIRYAVPGSKFVYTFAEPNGSYTVNLLFAELWGSGRTFNVKLNGATVLSNYSVFAKVGLDAADIESFPVNVTAGAITIEVDSVTNNSFLDAIEILPAGPPPPPPQDVTMTISGNLSFDDGSPVTDMVQITQVTPLPGGATNNNVLANFTPDSVGNISGPVIFSTNFQDQCVFNFYLFNSTGKQVGFMQQSIPGATFAQQQTPGAPPPIRSVSGFKIVLNKASCATTCVLGLGYTMGTFGQ